MINGVDMIKFIKTVPGFLSVIFVDFCHINGLI